MYRAIFIFVMFGLLICFCGQSQTSTQAQVSTYSYYPPSKDKESWQRLNLLLSSTYIIVVKEAQIDFDTCLYIASRFLGLSRFSILAEGIDDAELLAQSQWIDRQQPDAGIRQLSNAIGKKHLQLLILLGSYYAFQPHNYYKYRDSVDYFLNKAIEESKLLKEEKLERLALLLLGKIYIQANDSKGDSIYNFLLNECRKTGDKEIEARTLAYRGKYIPLTTASFQRKLSDLQQASDLYRGLHNMENEINSLTDLGYITMALGQHQTANELFLKALALAGVIHFPYTQYNTDALAAITQFQGKFGEPLRYTLQTIKTAELCRDSIGWGYFYSRLAALYNIEGRGKEWSDITQKAIDRFVIDRNPTVYNSLALLVDYLGNHKKAKEAFNLLLDISKKVNMPQTLSDQYFYHQSFTNCYLHLKKLDLAEMHIKQMDTLETKAEKIRGILRRPLVDMAFALLFFDRGEYQKARSYFEKASGAPENTDRSFANNLNTYEWLLTTDSILGDKESAIEHYRKYTTLLDSNFRATKIRQAEELQVQYETQEKENQIALLNQQTQLVKANLKQATLVKNLTIAGIAAVMIIAVLLYRQSRLRKKNNFIITQKNEQLQQLLDDKEKNNFIITNKNEQLQELLDDKEWLLREIHHRVKNNLQIIMSLLNSQSVYINNDAALTAIHDSQRRVHAISLIHQKLYQSENISSIAMPQYINELVSYLQDSFDTGNRIIFEQNIEPLDLDVSLAIPLGLIINEGIANALKYAFPNGQKGIVRISVQKDEPGLLLLSLSDNGVGLPANFDISKTNSLGLNLVQVLAKQLKGTVSMESNHGLCINVRFSAFSNEKMYA